jgi:ADP-ribose pyrophosphatase
MNNQKWKLIDKKKVFESKWLNIEDRSYELPDGKRVEGYFHLDRPNYVLILAVNSKNQVVVEKQYRRGVDDFVYELPAGWMNANESPIETAKRELSEETGFVGSGDKFIEIYPQPGFSSMRAFVVILNINDEKVEENKESDETLSYELIEIDKVVSMIRDGQIKDMGFLSAFSIFKSL